MKTSLRFPGNLLVAGALVFSSLNSPAAQSVSAHYANGQVWVTWDVEPQVLTNCAPTNQGVFVHTVRAGFGGHYAVRPFGVTNVPAAWRAPLTNALFSLADPARLRLNIGVPPPVPPCSPTPTLYVRLLTNIALELRWEACTNAAYQVESTGNFLQWKAASSPLAAPPGGGWLTNLLSAAYPYQFFRLHVLPLAHSPVPSSPGGYSLFATHGGIPRHYRLNLPAGYSNTAPAPLALILHGHNQTADTFAALHPELAAYANAQGVILVLPDSTSNARSTGWNDGEVTPENPVDDVSFLLALTEQLDATLNIDRKRVYAGGFSNGGEMCHWLAARTTNVFAALAAVASGIAGERGTSGVLLTNPPPAGPLPALIVNATNDCLRPFWGGPNAEGRFQASAFASAAHYTNANVCASLPVFHTNFFAANNGVIFRFEPCVPNGLGSMALVTNLVIREHYQFNCAPGTEVLFVTLTDGGHNWPDASDNVGFDANHEVLDFFLSHCHCNATGAVETLGVPTAPGPYELKLCDQGYSRSFRLQIPAGYNPMVPAPLVFVFHGGGQTAAGFSTLHPGLFTKCNAEGMILVLPQALVNSLAGNTLWTDKPFDVVTDDVAFVTHLLERLDAALHVDRRRVYATGFSSGGDFSHWLGSTTTGLLAAIAPVCATTGWLDRQTQILVVPPPPLEPMAVLLVRGGMDPKRPFDGDATAFSAQADTDYWVNGSGCTPPPVFTSNAALARWQYTPCAGTTEVLLIRVNALDHSWPDGGVYNANVQNIDFLLRHARP